MAAEKYQRLILEDKGRAFLHQELKLITGWSQSKANFLFGIHPSSNEGKNNDFFNKSFNMKNYLSLIFGFSICCLLLACTPNTKSKGNEIMPPQSAILHFGQQGLKDFTQYSNAPIDRQPAGMNFLSLDWRPPKLGQVKIVTEQSNFEIDNVISVMGTQIARMGNDGVLIMDVNASLHANEYTTREDAYQAYVKLMKQMSEKNWKQYFLPYSERIDKQDNLKYMSQNMGEVIDPSYILSFKEWQEMMDLTNGHMYFNLYNSNINLGISLSKTYKDDKKEQYMLRYSFEHFRYTGFNAISNSDEMTAEQLKQAFLDERRENEKDRKFKEQKIKLEGYHIDGSYVDPDVWQYMR
ncbi:hypothetical protein [Acinetobacter sp. DSM 11652]|uniref:hypothetical protein n=1 Tax=Acinetobacter sp. DSM 11652 TaxID=346222 RepID=UPI0008C59EE6|nr:hypothetical protein [Acinetobacter sp. DSM 11652]SEM16199.1 hypothetical protein SAMN05216500_112123 [Acinetobacter sp. DSM 11652]